MIFILILVVFLSSCSAPPPETLKIDFLSSMESVLNEEDKPLSLFDTLQKFRSIAETDELISVMHKGDTIRLIDGMASPDNKTILFTTGNKILNVYQDFYVTTKWSGGYFYSLDGEIWYSTVNDRKKDIINLHYDYPLKTHYNEDNRELTVKFSWKAGISDRAIAVDMNTKEIVSIRRDLIFLSTDKKMNSVNLNNYALKIPGGTKMHLNFLFSGNLLNSSESYQGTLIEILKNFYFYSSDVSNIKMGISLNGTDWNYSIFSFQYNLTADFKVIQPGLIQYNREMEILFD